MPASRQIPDELTEIGDRLARCLEMMAAEGNPANARRTSAHLLAWMGILDSLGWHVAMWLPGDEPRLSPRAIGWCGGSCGAPPGWEEIRERVENDRAVNVLVRSERVCVWAAGPAGDGTEAGSATSAGSATLTRREREVAHWLEQGKTAGEIAIILDCTRRTVECHLGRIYRKTGVRGRVGALFNSHPER